MLSTRTARLASMLVALVVLATACGEGLRPTLVEVSAQEPEELPPLVLDLDPAPPDVVPWPPTSSGFPLETSVDDAIRAWADDRQIPYLDACRLVTPGEGELCDTPTERETVRLLGPSADETWYVVTVLEAFTPENGRGYRVSEVTIAGR